MRGRPRLDGVDMVTMTVWIPKELKLSLVKGARESGESLSYWLRRKLGDERKVSEPAECEESVVCEELSAQVSGSLQEATKSVRIPGNGGMCFRCARRERVGLPALKNCEECGHDGRRIRGEERDAGGDACGVVCGAGGVDDGGGAGGAVHVSDVSVVEGEGAVQVYVEVGGDGIELHEPSGIEEAEEEKEGVEGGTGDAVVAGFLGGVEGA